MAALVRMRAPLLGIASLLSVSSLEGQSDMAFPTSTYLKRRAALSERVGAAVAVISSGYNINPGDNLTKPEPDFWYLTGVESPYAVLVMFPRPGQQGHDAVLFVPDSLQFAGGQFPMDDAGFRRAVWNRPRRRLAPGGAAAQLAGVSAVLPLSALTETVRTRGRGVSLAYTPLGDSLYAPPGLTAPRTFEAQFAQSVQALLPNAVWRDLASVVQDLRLIKDADEIAALRHAATISGKGMEAGLQALRPGMNDRTLAGIMEGVWKREGSPRAAFPPIVSSGENALTFFTLLRENYNAVDRVMKPGDLVFVDYGAAEFKMYTADLCRTWPVSGTFTPAQRRYYDIVLEAQEAAIAAVKPGVMMLDVIKEAARVFQRHGLEPYEDIARMGVDHVWGIMPSPTHYLTRDAGIVRYNSFGRGVRDLGHHIGLEVQDSRDYSKPLAPGMVITIEPKIYIPDENIAIMIEDMVAVTERGHENLSASVPKRAADIERIMRRAKQARPRRAPNPGA